MTSALGRLAQNEYAVLLTRAEIDRFGHHALFARELGVAFGELDIELRPLDYYREASEVYSALRDPSCAFFVCFNGFGSELSVSLVPQQLTPAMTVYGKRLFDLMHDCPAHDNMGHQTLSTYPERSLLVTDYRYAAIAQELGVSDVSFVPSITFPAHVGDAVKPLKDRCIEILLPVGLSNPKNFSANLEEGTGLKRSVYRLIYENVVEKATANWRVDPIVELFAGCRAADVRFDLGTADARFLLSTILDVVKFARRRRLVAAIAHLPVTIVTDQKQYEALAPSSRSRFVEQCSSSELLRLIGDSRLVICPTPHMTGYHERVLGTFSAGAVVVSAPNSVLSSHFVHGRDMVFFQDENQLAGHLAELIGNVGEMQKVADSGRKRAMQMFSPLRFAETVLSMYAMRSARA
jgi:hypothetical protein